MQGTCPSSLLLLLITVAIPLLLQLHKYTKLYSWLAFSIKAHLDHPSPPQQSHNHNHNPHLAHNKKPKPASTAH